MNANHIKKAAEYSNFAQWLKSEIWQRMEGNQLPEKALDEIAELLFKLQNAKVQVILEKVENLIAEEMFIAQSEGQPTSRLTSLLVKLKK